MEPNNERKQTRQTDKPPAENTGTVQLERNCFALVRSLFPRVRHDSIDRTRNERDEAGRSVVDRRDSRHVEDLRIFFQIPVSATISARADVEAIRCRWRRAVALQDFNLGFPVQVQHALELVSVVMRRRIRSSRSVWSSIVGETRRAEDQGNEPPL